MKIEWTQEKKDETIKRIEEWLLKHHADSGEMMMQDDACQIDSMNLLTDLVDDVIKPTTDDEEEL